MATNNIVKCVNCNVVISEVLAFICNKLDVMDEQSLTRICISAFTEADIVEAKNLLFNSISTTKRKVTRKKQGKAIRDIDDIVCLLKETDPEEVPIFVARDLQRLPPVLFDHVDVTRLLKDLLKMQQEINRISEEYATLDQLKELHTEIHSLKNAPIVSNFSRNVNVRRGACTLSSFEQDSGPVGLSPAGVDHIPPANLPAMTPVKKNSGQHTLSSNEGGGIKSPRKTVNGTEPASKQVSADRRSPNAVMNHTIPTVPASCVSLAGNQTNQDLQSDVNNKTFSVVVQEGNLNPQSKSQSPSDEWTVVQKKKMRNRFIGHTGNATADLDNKFKAANVQVPIYIYNVSKETTLTDISSYVLKKTNLTIKLDKMNMKINKDYDGYIAYIPRQKISMFLKNDFWPEGVKYRRFVNFARNTEKTTHKGLNGINSSVNG